MNKPSLKLPMRGVMMNPHHAALLGEQSQENAWTDFQWTPEKVITYFFLRPTTTSRIHLCHCIHDRRTARKKTPQYIHRDIHPSTDWIKRERIRRAERYAAAAERAGRAPTRTRYAARQGRPDVPAGLARDRRKRQSGPLTLWTSAEEERQPAGQQRPIEGSGGGGGGDEASGGGGARSTRRARADLALSTSSTGDGRKLGRLKE